ncbi:DUF4192 domain-containing protein [Mycolicibacterium sp. P1-18]|uniref:DUF4192 domain-containing protein n=1 Tax=Mycolicibacterium sp. P1-18 TaxID=2024615 RepID=UPI0011F3ED66|nr:DUF4192 domain-containing protein [Mycolicibacterium sp. P1-18]KAA0100960.1 DUF4192 domain-containing protein [Mycolicibacterium sp. P1-18]
MTTFRASDFHPTKPAALLAAIPALLGFVPEVSLVLVTFEDDEVGCVMRVDLSDEFDDVLDHVADVAATNGPGAAVAVIVDDDGAACRMCLDEHRSLSDVLDEHLGDRGVELLATYVVDRLEADGRWHRADGAPGSGVIDDPMCSPMAAAAVLDGRRLYARRTELQAVVAVDPVRAEGLRMAMLRAEHDGELRPDLDARRDVELVLAVARGLSEGLLPEDDDLAAVGCAIADTRVRDTLYALAVGREADRAEALWALLARALPDPWRVEALVLLAFSAYARGDGPLAGVSLEAALRCDGRHRMAVMLDQALQSGMRPEQIRELAQTGYRLAKRLGVRLPPRQGVGKRAG